ncbi:hypothetical protein AR687_15905 [Flavobacteriaceae bacterium CRH]|nr:hypothetical protein AR687_15905 [Flavobacteriaceae bacterium CRH]
MRTDHNRIKVADLEKNQPNKMLATGSTGELEFSDVTNITSVSIASDIETQTNIAVPEDNKVVSRSKLFNWWNWIKTQAHIITGIWTFKSQINTTHVRPITTKTYNLGDGSYSYANATIGTGNITNINSNLTKTNRISPNTTNLGLVFTNNAGNLARAVMFNNGHWIFQETGTPVDNGSDIIQAGGTILADSFKILPKALSTVPVNGAIERDVNGRLWTTRGCVRYI